MSEENKTAPLLIVMVRISLAILMFGAALGGAVRLYHLVTTFHN